MLRNKAPRGVRFRRRMFVVGAAQAALATGIGSRLYVLQALQADKYKQLADKNRIRRYYIPPSRGRLIDRNGAILARNRLYYRLFRDVSLPAPPENDRQMILAELFRLLKPSKILADELTSGFSAWGAQKVRRVGTHSEDIAIADGLSRDQASAIEVRRYEFPGFYVRKSYRRYYPYAQGAGHITGYIGAPGEKETKERPELRVPGMYIGKSGAERAFEAALHGQAGRRFVETDARSRPIRELERKQGIPGQDVGLALDMRLQTAIYDAFRAEGKNGCVVVLDVETGAILAYVSAPDYDPNMFTGGISRKHWASLMNNQDKPLLNRPITSQYPPGSTFKPCIALAALRAGISPYKSFYCNGRFRSGNRTFHCWKEAGHGNVDMRSAIRQSCNVYFYSLANLIGSAPMIETSRLLGLGQKTGIIFPEESSGLIPDADWKEARYGIPWQSGDSVNMSIGQGYVLTTPLQLAVMTAGIAGGKRITPHFSAGSAHEPRAEGNPPPLKGIDPAHLRLIRTAMEDVVNHSRGTARAHKLEDRDYSFAGKTGTVQVISKKARRIIEASGDKEKLARTEHHGLFVGYAPLIKPKAAFSIVVEHGGSGGRAAAPFAKKITQTIRELYYSEEGDV